jgi:cobalt-zinc-cadmium resistance protein CzcA
MNTLLHFIFKNKLMVIVLGLLIMIAGYFSYTKLPVDAFPDVSPNLVQVFTVTDGLAPEEIETYVTFPVETVMNGLPGIEKIRSVSNFGLSVVNIYFEDELDIYFARQLVNERLQEAREQIPEGFGEPELGPISTGMGLILFYYLEDTTGKYSLEELRTIQDWVVKLQLQNVPGVTEVLGIGGYEKQFQVNINPNALIKYDITIEDVIQTIESNNLNVGAQFLEKNDEEYIVRSTGLLTKIDDIKKLVVKTDSGVPVYLHDLASIEVGGAIRRGLQTRNGLGEVISGMVVKLYGTNSSTVIGQVEEKLEAINNSLPEGLKIVPYYEQKTLVEACVKTVTNALLQGIGLVVLVLFAFMGSLRPSLVVGLSIPFSVLFAFIGMNYFGLSANLMSFGGLAIAIGLLVDATIVIVENIDRHLRESDEHQAQSMFILMAVKEVIKPILMATTIIIVVFLPLFTLQGVEGKTFRPLAYTIALAMGGALLYAVFVAPVLSQLILKKKDHTSSRFRSQIERLKQSYTRILQSLIDAPKKAIALSVGLLIIGSIGFSGLGSEFTPALQEGTLVLRLTMAPSIALKKSKEMALLVEKRLMKISEVTGVVSRIGRGEVGAHADPVNSAEMYILLKPKDQWRVNDQAKLQALIRDELGPIPGAMTNFTQPIAMSIDELLEGVRAELAIKLFGDDLVQLKLTADEIAEKIRTIKGASDVQVDQVSGVPQLLITINRDKIARFGIPLSDVQHVIQTAVGGSEVSHLFDGVKRFPIQVRLEESYRQSKSDIEELVIRGPKGEFIPLSQLADIKEVVGPRQITRENNQRFISIQCNVDGRDIGSFVAEGQQLIQNQIKLPPGYSAVWGGQFELQRQANKRFAVVIPITLVLIIFLLYLSFNSAKSVGLILLNIPLALVGGVIGLWITGQNLSVPSSVGFIALFGIALGNGMVLVSYLNQLSSSEDRDIKTLSLEGALRRTKPVLMTTVTTALGLIPLLVSSGTGSEIQRPLATVVMGGLATSTLVTLFVIPAIYRWFIPIRQKD